MWVMSRMLACSGACFAHGSAQASPYPSALLADEVAASAGSPKASATVKMSLSPRPDWLIMMTSSRDSVGRFLEGLREGVRRLERRDQALLAHGQRQRVDHLVVGGGLEAHAAGLAQVREDRATRPT